MKIMITLLRKNGKCRSWTNATPCEHAAMSLTTYADVVKRLAKHWNMSIPETVDRIARVIKQKGALQ